MTPPSSLPAAPGAVPLDWALALVDDESPAGVAQSVRELALACGCRGAHLVWPDGEALDGAGRRRRALAAKLPPDGPAWLARGRQLAWRPWLHDATLVLQLAQGQAPEAVMAAMAPCLQLAERKLAHVLSVADLQESHARLERSETLQRALFAISDLAASDLDVPEMLRRAHVILSTLMYSENFFIVRSDRERGTLRFLYYADTQDEDAPDTACEYPLEDCRGSLTWHLLMRGEPLMGTSEQLSRQVEGPLVMVGPESFDWLGVPMVRDGLVHGALVVQSYEPDITFAPADRALLEFVASHLLTVLERKQSKDELEARVRARTLELAEANRGLQQEVLERQRAERLQAALFHIAELATADIDEDAFYQRVHAVVGELLHASNFFIALLSGDGGRLEFPYYVDDRMPSPVVRPLGRGLSEYVLRNGQPLRGTRAEVEALGAAGEIDLELVQALAQCWLGVPLRVGEGVIGLVVVQSYTDDLTYDAADQELLSFAALQIANSIHRRRSAVSLQRANAELELRVEERTRELRQQILEREHIQGQLKHQVMHDALTGLPNRGFLRDRLERVLALLQRDPGRRCALLYLDIDRFKVVNDSLGHLAGDEMLKEVAQRLLGCVREPDMVARLSGDEFAVLLEDVRDPVDAQRVACRVLDVLGETMHVAGKEIEASASIGIALADGSYLAADEVLRDADIALYRAKNLGRKRFELFDETLANDAIDVLAIEGELRRSLQHDDFKPWFQPICRLADGAPVGYEALLRWNHPREGVLAPADFLEVAEDSGHIEAIDWRVFEHACRSMAQQGRQDGFLTINVSNLHLRHVEFERRLVALLERTGLAPSRLVIEVTESALLDDPERVRSTLERLRRAGIGAALDDFGTGYSSLSYLHSLPLRMLKIDRSFVQALDSGVRATRTVVAAILALARALDIEVVAEGIETPAQRAALVNMGCELGQGYLLGRPQAVRHRHHSGHEGLPLAAG